jgi:hypothetical protein
MLHNQSLKNYLLKLFLTVSMLILMTFAMIPVDLTGIWKTEIDTPIGKLQYTFIFSQKGTQLTGTIVYTIEGEKNESVILDGKFVDGKISFSEKMKIQGEEIPVIYEGKPEGEVINFSRQVGDFGGETFVAKREKTEVTAPVK